MSSQKSPKKCPRCGSRNLQYEENNRKGRVIAYCNECDYEFEMHVGEKRHSSTADKEER